MAKTAEKKSKFSKEQYLKWYESMLLMRKFEEKTGQVYVQQKIKGFCHLYIGQEAIVAGTVSATKKEDKHILDEEISEKASKNLDKTINYSKNPPNWNKILEQILDNSDDSDEVVIL